MTGEMTAVRIFSCCLRQSRVVCVVMSAVGMVRSGRGHVPRGHVCWAFGSRSEFRHRAGEYLLDGVAAGQWIEYVGRGSREGLQAELAGVDGMDGLLDRGGVAVTPVAEFYGLRPGSAVVDPHAAVTARVAATEQALAAGYTGFRAVVDATAMVESAEQRRAFVQFEHLIDHRMATLPVTAMCGYARTGVGAAALAELACLHPLSNLDAPFRLYAQADGSLGLAGSVDSRCSELFAEAFGHAAAVAEDSSMVIDGTHLTGIEADQLRDLDRLAGRHGCTVTLHNAPADTARLLQHLDLDQVRSSWASE